MDCLREVGFAIASRCCGFSGCRARRAFCAAAFCDRRATISTFSIFPIDSVDKVVELKTCDPSLALMRIDEDRLGEADVFENGVYSFSCQPLYQDAWRIFRRRKV
ncbi:hypothetical protein [Novosphingobium guangzhouense]|uniref:hypothetical protein n=1 Tax=Novosphingobium guangzhouense TaxID=1850347 RepID=UPI0011AFA39B|nr:hypothetical protein [Novosphingobium guangzhouense]